MLQLMLKSPAKAQEVRSGYPWIMRGEIEFTSQLELTEPGELVQVVDNRAKPLALAYFNPRNALCARILSRDANARPDASFFRFLFTRAMEKRDTLFGIPFYRMAHAEADALPGLIIDRYGDYVVCQITTAGMERLLPVWLPALEELLTPKAVVFDRSPDFRTREGLEILPATATNEVPEAVPVIEHGRTYFADLISGQKTGWFYDQRENREQVKREVQRRGPNVKVLDVYTHSGGFGLAAADGGAASVELVDRSALALELAEKAARHNGFTERCIFTRAEAFRFLEQAVKEGRQYEVVIADPPAFIKQKQHTRQGLAGYAKLAQLCARLVAPQGTLFIASCSHHAAKEAFRQAVEEGIRKAGRSRKRFITLGADKDHPLHPQLEESEYLKFLGYYLDEPSRTR
jgi:23S rRNA (cytosine1962-C5)-methyltransferase